MPRSNPPIPAPQSSVLVTLRALVMLTALVFLLACAFFNASVREFAGRILPFEMGGDASGDIASNSNDDKDSLSSASNAAGPLTWNVADADPTPITPTSATPTTTSRPIPPPSSSGGDHDYYASDARSPFARSEPSQPRSWPEPSTGERMPTSHRDPVSDARAAASMSRPDYRVSPPVPITPRGLCAADRYESPSEREPVAEPPLAEPGREPLHVFDQSAFEPLERRLRALGASYYRLEFWQGQGTTFRFSCRVTVDARNPNYSRPFESTAPTPLAAMQRVLDDVEQWRERQRMGSPQ